MLLADIAPTASDPITAGWQPVDFVLLSLLPLLLALSACFNAAETAFFSMTEVERQEFRRSGSIVGRSVELLLSDQRMLLITILLSNMTVSVLFFVISSTLMMRFTLGLAGQVTVALISVLAIVIGGDVVPKMAGTARRATIAAILAPPLLTLHTAIGPIRVFLSRFIVQPLSAMTAPTTAPAPLDEQELKTLIEISSHHGVIDADEQRILSDVLSMSRLKVRDVMTPRVRMHALSVTSTHADIVQLARESRLTKLPVYEADLDHIIGVLPLKNYLLDASHRTVSLRTSLASARFVPVMARLDQLMEHFRKTRTQSAIVVDEFGGTEGVVSVEDVVESLVGDIIATDEHVIDPPRMIGFDKWLVDGDTSVHDWAEAFGQRLVSSRVATLGGLIIERLGRAAEVGDVIDLGNVRLEVATVDRSRVESAIVTLIDSKPKGPGT